jgi:hypothetical protein
VGQIPIPLSLVALLPQFLEFIEKILDSAGLLGKKFIRSNLAQDDTGFIRYNFVESYSHEDNFKAIETYFDFEESASDILKRHLSFMLSLYFASIAKTHDFLKLEGLPVAGMIIVGLSLFIFIILLFVRNRWSGAAENPLRWWSYWTWAIFLAIVGWEIVEHL